MQKIAIIVPCYNEFERLQPGAFSGFLDEHDDVTIFFVNDGSSDKTPGVLEAIHTDQPIKTRIIHLPKNGGKGRAIREGLLAPLAEGGFTYAGYLDADLSTSLAEYYRICQFAKEKSLDYVLGSRIKILQSSIRRSFFRHIAGRFIATIIDSRFRLGIYDTQCGAKCFKVSILQSLLDKPFRTKWFFDVELFLRARKLFPGAKGMEIPLDEWTDPGKSRLNIFHFPAVTLDIISLMRNYSRTK